MPGDEDDPGLLGFLACPGLFTILSSLSSSFSSVVVGNDNDLELENWKRMLVTIKIDNNFVIMYNNNWSENFFSLIKQLCMFRVRFKSTSWHLITPENLEHLLEYWSLENILYLVEMWQKLNKTLYREQSSYKHSELIIIESFTHQITQYPSYPPPPPPPPRSSLTRPSPPSSLSRPPRSRLSRDLLLLLSLLRSRLLSLSLSLLLSRLLDRSWSISSLRSPRPLLLGSGPVRYVTIV